MLGWLKRLENPFSGQIAMYLHEIEKLHHEVKVFQSKMDLIFIRHFQLIGMKIQLIWFTFDRQH